MKAQVKSRAVDLSRFGTPRSIEALSAFKRAVLFGAGASAGEVERVLARYDIPVVAFADNGTAKQGTLFRGCPVIAPAALPAMIDGATAVIIASVYQVEIATQLRDLGIPASAVFPFISPMFAGHFGATAFAGLGDLLAWLPGRLADDASRAYVEALMAFRWTMDPLHLARNPRQTGYYDYDGVGPNAGDHIVDVGAYDGDSAIAYLKRLNGDARVSALEPLPQNFAALERTIAAHDFGTRITPVPFGAGDAPMTAEIDSYDGDVDPRATLRGKPGERASIRIETLDRLFAHDGVDFIKIDIEGHDPAALEGARAILQRDRPGLAIAAYHAPDHLWRIPALLDRHCPGYRIHAGHHPAATYECELFCVHEDRADERSLLQHARP